MFGQRTHAFPQWFKKLPMYETMVMQERAAAEALRTALATERDTIAATEAREAPKRQKLLEAATAKVAAAEEALKQARRASESVQREVSGPAQTASARQQLILNEIRTLADPCIAEAQSRLLDLFDTARVERSPAGRLDAIRSAQQRIAALLEMTGVDARTEVARIMETVLAESPEPLAAA